MQQNIKLIALDLDGTLLNSNKTITPRTFKALQETAKLGILIVPCTGRFYSAMPPEVQSLPGTRYAITINGAAVFDFERNITICKEEIPYREAIEVFDYLDSLSVLYDCYLDNRAFMTAHMKTNADQYLDSPYFLEMIRKLRQPVPDLKQFVLSRQQDVQKIIMYTKDPSLRQSVLNEFCSVFPNCIASSSIPQNVEINQKHANKGRALELLCNYLSIPREESMAFGDGLNDISMIAQAGIGVCMGNGEPAVKSVANLITADNDHDGIAEILEQYVLARKV